MAIMESTTQHQYRQAEKNAILAAHIEDMQEMQTEIEQRNNELKDETTRLKGIHEQLEKFKPNNDLV